jgi:FkbH-like protein
MTDSGLLRSCRQKWQSGARREALEALERGLRNGSGAAEFEAAGRFLEKRWEAAGFEAPTVQLLGQCTTSWLKTCLVSSAFAERLPLRVLESEYDSVIQTLAELPRDGAPRVLVFIPWHQRLLSPQPARSAETRVLDELAFWRNAWALAQARGIRVVQVGYDLELPGPLGYHLGGGSGGPRRLVRELNDRLRAELPQDAFFVDLEQLAGDHGRERFYSPRRYFWTKQPFSEAGCLLLAQHVFAAVRATLLGPKKVLVVDLDNTLWGGVVGETGPLGIELSENPDGEAFRAFQRHVKGLAERGIVVAVCSKNNPADAREPFEKNPNMVLGLSDIAAFEASWDRKSEVLPRIARDLNLGLDSFVFFDDNPAEREEVRQALPDVTVVEVPPDPADFVRALEAGLHFESMMLTQADHERTRQYRAEAGRREAQTAFASVEDYLRSLEMVADVRSVDEADLPRVVQLLGKTNQFNVTTRRHSTEFVKNLIAQERSIALTFRLRDRFGDHGLVCVVLAAQAPDDRHVLVVDTWLMSCRVIGRTLEEYVANALAAGAHALGYREIHGEYIPTPKNAVVATLFSRLGYAAAGKRESSEWFGLDLGRSQPLVTFVGGASN